MIPKISCHGGHSGKFCCHARDTLAEMVAEYYRQGFDYICLTEHMPPISDEWLYPDEHARGLSATVLQERFRSYISEARLLASEYLGRMTIYVGMESEWYPGVENAVSEWRPQLDLVVGSVHHVRGIGFDYSRQEYERVLANTGSVVKLYCDYFDAQLVMLNTLKPEVVGHFDLIRLFNDEMYLSIFKAEEVWKRIERNLDYIRHIDAIMDVNSRALLKQQAEPYVCLPIRQAAMDRAICLLPGDDAHGIADVGYGMDVVMAQLEAYTTDTVPVSVADPARRWAKFFSMPPKGADLKR